MDLSFDLLRTFLAVVDTGNFTMAGEPVHLTQSAVSMQLKRLTEAVGRPLFHIQGEASKKDPLPLALYNYNCIFRISPGDNAG